MSGLEIKHKKNFHMIRWTVALIVLALVMVYAYFGVRWYNTGELSPFPLPVAATDASTDETAVSDKLVLAHTVPAGQPRYLEIPKLGIVQARIVRVGTTAQNLLDTPKTLDDAGWYTKSSTPGSDAGAVLINGNSKGSTRAGLFAKLRTLSKGDQITIERGDGKSFTYEVQDVRDMPFEWVNKYGMKEMMRSVLPSKEGLNLMTTSGTWIPKDKLFDHRVLVRTTVVE